MITEHDKSVTDIDRQIIARFGFPIGHFISQGECADRKMMDACVQIHEDIGWTPYKRVFFIDFWNDKDAPLPDQDALKSAVKSEVYRL